MDVCAMLLAEDGNPYNVNAVSVWIDGLMIGYLPRDEARRLRVGLLALQEHRSKPVAVEDCRRRSLTLEIRSCCISSGQFMSGSVVVKLGDQPSPLGDGL
jgi:hypothetical protein